MKRLTVWLNHIWYDKTVFRFLLWPFSLLYLIVVLIRRTFYQMGLLKSEQFSVPVIIIGNIVVGGTGKTPLVIELTKQLQNRGFKPGIVSRGYGGNRGSQVLAVTGDSDPMICGDEPVLLAQKTQVPIVIAKKRSLAVKKLLNDFACDIVLSDDGLQHYSLKGDIEIAVVDAKRKNGNGFCLPAGPLREPASRLATVDFVLLNGVDFKIQSNAFYQLINPENQKLASEFSEKVHAVAGIANPVNFFKECQESGLRIFEHPFPDHHRFTREDLNFSDDAPVIVTEKDAIKIRQFGLTNVWVLPITAVIPSDFINKLTTELGKAYEKHLYTTTA